jgi:hypothetical protein
MTTQMSDEAVYEEARKRVKAKTKFYKNVIVYVIVNATLVLVWAFPAGGGYPWFLWVLGFWGLALLLDFFDAFVWQTRMSKGAIEKEAERIKKEQGSLEQ